MVVMMAVVNVALVVVISGCSESRTSNGCSDLVKVVKKVPVILVMVVVISFVVMVVVIVVVMLVEKL